MSNLQRPRAIVLLAPALLFAGAASRAQSAGLPWEVWQSPTRFAALDADDIVVQHSSHCLDGCRYDRSNPGPESPVDNPYPMRWLYRDADEVVLFDERGPGALTRLWMTTGDGVSRCIDPSIRVRFRFDGALTPTLDIPLAAMFDGSLAPFTAPLVADRAASSGGYVSRVPIAYAESLRISLLNAESAPSPCDPSGWRLLWYQFTAHRLRPGADVTSFAAGQDAPGLRAFLATPSGSDPWHGMLAMQPFSQLATPPMLWTLATRSGSGALRGIRLDVPAQWRSSVTLRLWFDGVLTVDMPLTDFFASDAGGSARSILFGEAADGVLYAWWPMPYASEARVELLVAGPLGVTVPISGSLAFDDAVALVDGTHFHARSTARCTSLGSMTLDEARGAGKLVGLAARYRADGVIDRAYLEGDERMQVDDAPAPAWYGTGVEDLHDGGFYFDHGAFLRGLSGAASVDADGSGETMAYRVFATDPVVYASALHMTQEAGLSPHEAVPTCARHVIHGYQRDRPLAVSLGRFEVGDAAAASWHAYEPAPSASCSVLHGQFGDEPPTARTAGVCRYTSGSSRFRFALRAEAPGLRLRRTFDVGDGEPGLIAGAPGAEVRVDGKPVGRFPPAAANPLRRWQQQEILLGVDGAPGWLDIEVIPEFAAGMAAYSESAWELRGSSTDAIFADGFEPWPSGEVSR